VIESTADGGRRSSVRRAKSGSYAWLWLLVAIQIAIPASYYLRDTGRDDERFAWRMFSGVRLKRCTALLREQQGGRAVPVPLRGALHSSWIHAVERGRQRVIERFLSARCDRGADSVLLERRCQRVEPGRPTEIERHHMDCATRNLALRGEP